MQRGTRLIWMAVSLLAVADLLLCRHLQLRFYHWMPLASACAVVTAIGLFYHLTGRSAVLARAAYWTLLWLLFVNAGTVLIYVAAACGGTAHDSTLAAADAALGFDWRGWYDFLAPHRGLRFALWLAYSSLFPQILLSIFWFSSTGADDTNYELLLTNIVSLLATTAIFFGFPAIGHQETPRGPDLAVLLALRAGGPLSFDLSQLARTDIFPLLPYRPCRAVDLCTPSFGPVSPGGARKRGYAVLDPECRPALPDRYDRRRCGRLVRNRGDHGSMPLVRARRGRLHRRTGNLAPRLTRAESDRRTANDPIS